MSKFSAVLSCYGNLDTSTIAVVVEMPKRLYTGKVSIGQRLRLKDLRMNGDMVRIAWFENGRGEIISMPLSEADRCMADIVGPRRPWL